MWILVPRVSPSAQASEDWTSPPKWSLELAESVTWRGKQRASSSWLRAWKKGGWIRRLFTRMPEPSMADRGVAEWISSLPVTRASHSASLAKGSQKQTQGTSGQTSSESSPRFVQHSLFSRTSKDTSSEASAPSSVTLTNWGSMRSGEFTQLSKPDTRTVATGSSSWPTAVAGDSKSCGAAGYSTASGRHSGTTLTDASRHWPTPQARDFRSPDLKGSGNYDRKVSKGYTIDLNSRVVNWATPTAQDYKDGTDPSPNAPTNALPDHQDPTGTGQVSPSTSGRRLNPLFVEWLMSFPAGWTVCEPSETLSAQRKQLWHCGTSAGGSSDG